MVMIGKSLVGLNCFLGHNNIFLTNVSMDRLEISNAKVMVFCLEVDTVILLFL